MLGICSHPIGTQSVFSFCIMQPGKTALNTMVRAIIEPIAGCNVSGSCCIAMITVSDAFGTAVGGTAVGGTGVAVTTICSFTGVPATTLVTSMVWTTVWGW